MLTLWVFLVISPHESKNCRKKLTKFRRNQTHGEVLKVFFVVSLFFIATELRFRENNLNHVAKTIFVFVQ